MSDHFLSTFYCGIPTSEIVRTSVNLCAASYEEGDHAVRLFLAKNGHRLHSLFVSYAPDGDGHYIVAEKIVDDRKITFVSIRGSYTLSDWGTNVQAWPAMQDIGTVHAGWYNRSLYLPLNYIIECLKRGDYIVICGHSLGGAVAQLFTAELMKAVVHDQDTTILQRILCVTFASPLIISGIGADLLNIHNKSRFINIVQEQDVVPKILFWSQEVLISCSKQLKSKSINPDVASGIARDVIVLVTCVVDGAPLPTITELLKTVLKSAARFLLNSRFVVDLLSYKPVGQFYLLSLSAPNVLPLLSDDQLSEYHGSFRDFIFAPSFSNITAHKMTVTYGAWVLRILREQTPGDISPFVRTEPAPLLMPLPSVHMITVSQAAASKGRAMITVHGRNLYAIKSINTKDLPLPEGGWRMRHTLVPADVCSSVKLCFSITQRPPGEVVTPPPSTPHPIAPAATSGVSVTLTSFFTAPGADQNLLCSGVLVRVLTHHPYDVYSLRELVHGALTLYVFAATASTAHFQSLHRTITKVLHKLFRCVPRVLLSSDSIFLFLCVADFRNHSVGDVHHGI